MKSLFILIAASLITLTLTSGCQEEARQPNILFIMSDDHTAQAWGI